jgi:hypothetical protein
VLTTDTTSFQNKMTGQPVHPLQRVALAAILW